MAMAAIPLKNCRVLSNFSDFRQFFLQCRHFRTSPISNGRFVYYNIHRKCTKPEQQDEKHFEKEALKIDFGPGYIDKLCEIWKEKMSVQRELLFKKDDRLVKHDSNYWLPKVEPETLKLDYQKVPCIKDAPDVVKKIFSVEYGERKDLTALYKHLIIDRVRTNALDDGETKKSMETKIAKMTANIRQWTMLLESMERKPGWLRKMIRLTIEKRRKYLRLLREQSLESFENLLKELKIAYHVPPLPEDTPLHTRKGWVEDIVNKKCALVKEEKLRRYHAILKKDHEAFKKQRDETVSRLRDEFTRLKDELEGLRTEENDEKLTVAGKYVGDTIGEVSEHLMHFWFYKKPVKQKTAA